MKRISNSELNKFIDQKQKIFENTNSVQNLVLDNTIIEYFNFKNLDFLILQGRNLEFANCSFENCDLTDSQLLKINLKECSFERCELSKVEIEGLISECRFIKCCFYEAMFNGNKISKSDFFNCNFANFNLSYCEINNCKLIDNYAYNYIKCNQENNVYWNPSPHDMLDIDQQKLLYNSLIKLMSSKISEISSKNGWYYRKDIVALLKLKEPIWKILNLNVEHFARLNIIPGMNSKKFEFKGGENHSGYIKINDPNKS